MASETVECALCDEELDGWPVEIKNSNGESRQICASCDIMLVAMVYLRRLDRRKKRAEALRNGDKVRLESFHPIKGQVAVYGKQLARQVDVLRGDQPPTPAKREVDQLIQKVSRDFNRP